MGWTSINLFHANGWLIILKAIVCRRVYLLCVFFFFLTGSFVQCVSVRELLRRRNLVSLRCCIFFDCQLGDRSFAASVVPLRSPVCHVGFSETPSSWRYPLLPSVRTRHVRSLVSCLMTCSLHTYAHLRMTRKTLQITRLQNHVTMCL